MSVDPVVATIIRFALGWLFLAAPAHKLRDMVDFRSVLATYRIMPERLVVVAAWLVVFAEVAIGLGMLWQFAQAFIAGAALLLVYAAVMAINLVRGRRFIDCGCGGATQPLSIGLVLRNVVLAVAAIVALVPTPARPLGWLDVVSMAAGVLVLGALYAATNQLLAARARLEEWV
jgi:uncharacterized membrane protein YphA (DoxX/SURF4 family)